MRTTIESTLLDVPAGRSSVEDEPLKKFKALGPNMAEKVRKALSANTAEGTEIRMDPATTEFLAEATPVQEDEKKTEAQIHAIRSVGWHYWSL